MPSRGIPCRVGGVGRGGGQPLVHGAQGEVLLVEPGEEVEGGGDADAQPVARMRSERAGSAALPGAAQQGPVHVGARQVRLLGRIAMQKIV